MNMTLKIADNLKKWRHTEKLDNEINLKWRSLQNEDEPREK